MGTDHDQESSHADCQTINGSEAVTATTPLHNGSQVQTCHLVQSGNTFQNGSSVVDDNSSRYHDGKNLRTSGGATSNHSRTRESSQHRSNEIDTAPPGNNSRAGANTRGTAGSTPSFMVSSNVDTVNASGTVGAGTSSVVHWNGGGSTIDGFGGGDMHGNNNMNGAAAAVAAAAAAASQQPYPYQLSPRQHQQLLLQQQQNMQQQPRASTAHGSLQGSAQQLTQEQARRAIASAQLRSYGSNSSMVQPAAVLDDLSGTNPNSAVAPQTQLTHNTDLSAHLQMASVGSSKHPGPNSTRGDGTIMNALNAYRAHIAAAVHDSLESHPDGTGPPLQCMFLGEVFAMSLPTIYPRK